jgi:hypothetical protein
MVASPASMLVKILPEIGFITDSFSLELVASNVMKRDLHVCAVPAHKRSVKVIHREQPTTVVT